MHLNQKMASTKGVLTESYSISLIIWTQVIEMAVIPPFPFTGVVMTLYIIYRLVYFLMQWSGGGFESFDSEENRRISRFKGCLLLFAIWIIFAVFEYLYILMMIGTLSPSEVSEDLPNFFEYYLMLGFLLAIDILWQIYQLRDYVWAVFDAHFHSSSTTFTEC
jgi:hypothetical protein